MKSLSDLTRVKVSPELIYIDFSLLKHLNGREVPIVRQLSTAYVCLVSNDYVAHLIFEPYVLHRVLDVFLKLFALRLVYIRPVLNEILCKRTSKGLVLLKHVYGGIVKYCQALDAVLEVSICNEGHETVPDYGTFKIDLGIPASFVGVVNLPCKIWSVDTAIAMSCDEYRVLSQLWPGIEELLYHIECINRCLKVRLAEVNISACI